MEVSEILTLKDLGFYITFPFPETDKNIIIRAIKSLKIEPKQNQIQKNLDSELAEALKNEGYYYSKDVDPGKSSKCKLWEPDFQNSVDLFNPERKIAIEIEKAEIKRVIHDILKLVNASKTFKPKVRFGVLMVPDKYFVGSRFSNFIGQVKKEISFYFGGVIDGFSLLDILIIAYKVNSK